MALLAAAAWWRYRDWRWHGAQGSRSERRIARGGDGHRPQARGAARHPAVGDHYSAPRRSKAQIFDLREVAKLAPGAHIQTVSGNGGPLHPSFIFRGLTSANPLPRIQTGAVFVDGIFVLGSVNAVNTVDVQRVGC